MILIVVLWGMIDVKSLVDAWLDGFSSYRGLKTYFFNIILMFMG